MSKRAAWMGMGIALAAAAWALPGALTVTVNGKPCAVAPIEKDGEVFVPVSALKAAGAEVAVNGEKMTVRFIPVPGAVQIDAVEGGLDEWMTDGLYRIKVSNPRTEDNIFKLDIEIRNATKVPLSPAVHTGARVPELFDAAEGILTTLPRSDRAWSEIATPNLPPAAAGTRTLEWSVKKGQQPTKLLIRFEMNPTRETVLKKLGVAFAGPANFRIKVD